MKNLKISISGYGSISALGINSESVWKNYLNNRHCFHREQINNKQEWVARLSLEAKELISTLIKDKKYQQLDPSVLYAIAASRIAVKQAAWNTNAGFGINMGSSRGATESFEKYHSEFIENGRQKVNPLTSPGTTLGNIASWVASDQNINGPSISHSATCSTALQSIANAAAWLKAGFCTRFLAGGSEAPLTPFTIAQMKALKIYSAIDQDYPCRSMDLKKDHNTLILGEGAACFCLELDSENAIGFITGIGFGTEIISHGASLSSDAACLQKSMNMALEGHDPASVDVVILHSPGTILGDSSEMIAIESVFGKRKPMLTGNKWKIGHTFGASGALSLEMALLMLKHDQFIQVPFIPQQKQYKPLQKILINAAGFGGTAFSILVENNPQN
ncbi:MAG: beta-ketoacyl synthase N-terminal-like domain-containing protein [Daejeonella sp.]|uniref:beta-ketoacyl synthase N-terminal-like domain-containing protein n=1 Tax=Daejeonella sp. TaxID=2805397 RepID=UPI00273258DE|nr:beta-ketoacyl synthase N-terminal-like domain-containing protein [Daejeonella sp.]MDP3467884.1 beta-ketoacyl synthase N-terminal-like domain-containing protein [Daejeonella sp.]